MRHTIAKSRNCYGKKHMTATFSDVFHNYVEKKYAPLKGAAKLLARDAGVSPRTAESWLYRKASPQGDNLIRLMAECRELRNDIFRLVEDVSANLPDKP